MGNEFQEQVAQLLEVAMFENWLRFYFIREESPDVLKLELPTKTLAKIQELYPELYPLAAGLNDKPIDFETSRNAVVQHVLNHMDGIKWAQGMAASLLQSRTFQIRLELFHIWEQMHENQLDQGFLDFGAWKDLFARWLETPGAQELAKKMARGDGTAHS